MTPKFTFLFAAKNRLGALAIFLLMLAVSVPSVVFAVAPTFTGGSPQSLSICQNTATSINSLLQINDADLGQTETWTVFSGPAHGTITLGGTQISTGGVVTPTGFSYTPTAHYGGTDAFTIQVSDGTGGTALTTINVTVSPNSTTGTNSVCTGFTTNLSNSTPGGVWTSSNVTIANVGTGSGVVTGFSPGVATISYTVGGCSGTMPVTVNQTPTGISGTFTMCQGGTQTLTNGYGGGVWTSSAPGVASVNPSTGLVTGVSSGNATITYTLTGGCIATQVVTVNGNPAGITGTTVVCVNGNVTLADATAGGVFTSSSPGTATIGGGTGLVTGIAAGTINITYTLGTGCFATTPLTVNPLPANITGTLTVCAGLTTSLADATAGGTWTSSTPATGSVVPATNVTIAGVAAGTTTITYTLGTGCFKTTVVTVNPLPAAITGTASVCVGLTTNLSNATGTGVWTSSNPALATIGSTTGVVTGIGAGNPVVNYTLATGCLQTVTLTVNPLPASIGGTFIACPGTSATLTDATAGGVWVSNNTAVATIGSSTGTFTGVSAGTSTITYTLPTGCMITTTITINPNPAGITGAAVVCVNSTTTLASATGGGLWSSSNTALGSIVSGTGVLTGVAAGNPVITYTLPTGCITTKLATVNPLPATITGTFNVCVGGSTTLADGSGTSTWSSSNTSFATIGASSGIVNGVAAGALTMTFTLPTGCFVTQAFTVNPTPAAIAGTTNVCVGSTTTLTDATGGGLWSSSNGALATVGSTTGIVTGVAAGNPSITYTLPAGCFAVSAFTVNAQPPAIGTSSVSSFTTPGAYTYVVPAGITSVNVSVSGAQGGSNGSGVGGNGGQVQGALTVTPGQQLFIFVGAQGPNYVSTGAAGGSSFGGGEDGGGGGASNGGAGGGAASDIRTSIAGGASSVGSLNSRVFVGGGGGGGAFSCSPRLNGGIGGFPAGANGLFSCSTAPTGGSQTSGGIGTCYSGNCGTNGGQGFGGAGIFFGGGGGGGYFGGAGGGEASGSGGSSFAGAGTSGVTFNNGAKPNGGSVSISFFLATNTMCVGSSLALSNGLAGGTWTSSNTAIATVNSSTGLVAGISAGPAVITYTTTGGCFTTLAITVNPTPSANTGSNNVCVGSTTTLANSTSGGAWTSSTASALVNSTTGVVTGVTAGTTTITYALPTGCFTTTAMTVNSTPGAITGASSVCTGFTTTLTSTGGGTFTSSNTSVATVVGASGVVTGVLSGTVNITYTTNPGSCFVTFPMTVNPSPTSISGSSNLCIGVNTPLTNGVGGGVWTSSNSSLATIGSATGIAVGVTIGNPVITYTLPAGCFSTLNTTVNTQPGPITGVNNICVSFSTTLGNTFAGGAWTSSNTSVATINSASGVLNGVSAGTTTITYTLPGGCTSTLAFTVNPQPAANTGTAVVCVNSTTTLANATFGGVWSSSNSGLASVGSSSGIVTGVSAGNPTISYTLPAGCFSITNLTVNALPAIFTVTGGGAYCSGGTGVPIGLSNSVAGINYQLFYGTVAAGSPIAGTGSAISFGLQTGAGTYTVVATNATTGCSVIMTGSANVFINPLPGTFTVTGGGAYCAGGAGLHVFLSGSSPLAFTYQLFRGVTVASSPLAGTGTSLDFGFQTIAGTYTVVATNNITGCTNTMVGSAVISVNPLPTAYAVTGGGGYCTGGTGVPVGIATSDVGISYQLFLTGSPVGSPLAGTGSALNFGLKTTAGVYTIVATNTITSCQNSMTGSATVTINPLPTAYAVTGGGGYCAGGTGMTVGLGGSATGVNYQLFINGTPSGAPVTGTGSSFNFGTYTTSGVYTVVGTDISTACTKNMTGSVTVSINPLPVAYNVTGGGAYCAGGAGLNIGMSNSQVGVSYQLFDATATPIGGPFAGTGTAFNFGLITAASTYTVVATNTATTCVNNMTGSALIVINPVPSSAFVVTGGGGYCTGGLGVPVGLSASVPGINYQLYNGISTVGASLAGGGVLTFGNQTAAGTYTVRGTDPITACSSIMTGSVVVTINPLPVAYNVTGGGAYCSGGTGVLVGLSSSNTGVKYQLYIGGTLTGAPVVGTGTSISFGLQTGAGVCTVIATDTTTASLCTNNMAGSVTVAVNPLPIAYTVTGGGGYCAGGAGINVGLSASNVGINYQLYNGATAVGGPLAGSGAALDYGSLTALGTYTVSATSTTTGCRSDMTGSANVYTNPTPTVYTVTGGGSYCAGGSGVNVGISGSDLGVNYQLYNGITTVGAPIAGTGGIMLFGLQTAAGNYTVQAVDGTTGCLSTMTGFANVAINPLPNPYSVTGGGGYCAGGSGVAVGLSGSQIGVNYQLKNPANVGLPLAGTGSALNFGLQASAGTYTVVATNGTTLCVNNMSSSAVVTINPLPGLFIVSGGGSYCAGGSGAHVFLGGSAIGVNYQLYLGASAIGSMVLGTGAALDFGAQTAAGTYTVKATNAVTGCTATMVGSAIVSINPLPTAFTMTGGGNYCPGGVGVDVSLSNSTIGVDYTLWLGATPIGPVVSGIGGAISFGLQTTPGFYTVTAMDATSGCSNNMTGGSTVGLHPLPTLHTVTGGGSYCDGGAGVAVSLNGSETGVNYQLSSGGAPVGPVALGTGSVINFGMQTLPGDYIVIATDPVTTCVDTMVDSANVVINPLPVDQTLTGGGAYCSGGTGVSIYLLSSEFGVSYQLFRGSTPVGSPVAGTGIGIAMGMQTVAGVYWVTATNTSTLCSATMSTSDTISISPLPTIYNVNGGGGYCVGGTGVTVGLSNSQVGLQYRLFLDGVYTGTVVAGTGSAISFGLQTAGGVYRVKAMNTTTGCQNDMAGSATITINPLPTAFNVTGGGGYCTGGTGARVGLSGSAVGYTYQLMFGTTPVGSPLAGTGSALDFGLQTLAGTYSVKGTNNVTGCNRLMSGSATIVVNPLPTAYTVFGSSTSYCTGSAGVTIYVSNTQVGVNYQLYLGGTPIGAALPGTGTSIDFGPQSTPGAYSVRALNTATGCANNMTGVVNVTVNPLPNVFAVIGGGNYCVGGTGVHVGLASSNTGIRYQLSNSFGPVGAPVSGTGAALDFGLQTVGGTYTVTATNATTGCTISMAGSVSVNINPLPLAFSVTGGGSYCAGGSGVSIGLSNSISGNSYQLMYGTSPLGAPMTGTGLALNFGTYAVAGTYSVVATTDATGCAAGMTGTASVVVNPLPTQFVMTGGGNYCPGTSGVHVGLSGSTAGVDYKLYRGTTLVAGPVSASGGSLDFGLFNVAGTYTAVAVNPSTTCTSNMLGSVVVGVNPLPAPYNVVGGGNYCSGTGGLHVGLSSSAPGITYELLLAGVPTSVTMTGTGAPIDFGLQTAPGVYTVLATNPTTGCTNLMTASATITMGTTVTPTVTVATGTGDTICAGNLANFTAIATNEGTGPAYQWTINGTNVGSGATYSYVPADGDVVGVVLTSSAVCATPSMVSGSIVMRVLPMLMPSVNVTTAQGSIVCRGTIVDFTATPTNGGATPSYTWLKNNTPVGTTSTFSYLPANGDVIKCVLSTSYMCPLIPSATSAAVTMEVDAPVTPIVSIIVSPGTALSAGENVTFTALITNAVPLPSYQWAVNGVDVAGETMPVFSTSSLNNLDIVTCKVTSGGGCPGLSGTGAITVTVVGVGVRQVNASNMDVKLTPNPNNGLFTVKGNIGTVGNEEVSLELINMLGQVVYSSKAVTHNGDLNETIRLSDKVANGMYILNLRSENGNKVFHVIIEQ